MKIKKKIKNENSQKIEQEELNTNCKIKEEINAQYEEDTDVLRKKKEIEEKRKKIMKWVCPECGGVILHDPIGCVNYCKKCGRIYEDAPIDYGKEWRNYGEEEEKARTGGTTNYSKQDKGLSTEIKTFSSDIMGTPLPTKTKIKFARLKKFHYRIRIGSTGRKNLYLALQEIERLCSQLNIPKTIREDAAFIYTIGIERGILKGKSIEGMVATALYMVAKVHRFPLTLHAMRKISNVNTKAILKYKRILEPIVREKFKEKTKILDADVYLEKFSRDYGVPPYIETEAREILNKAKEEKLVAGRNHIGFAFASLYIASKKHNFELKNKQINDIGYQTLVKRINELEQMLGFKTEEKNRKIDKNFAINLLKSEGCNEDVIEHCIAVSKLAIKVAKKIAKKLPVDIELVKIGALLHDLGRSKTHGIKHGIEGANIVRRLEIDENIKEKLAKICERHIGAGISKEEAKILGLEEKDYIPETIEEKIVAHCDNLIDGTKKVKIEKTIAKFEERLGKDHEAIKRIKKLNDEIELLLKD